MKIKNRNNKENQKLRLRAQEEAYQTILEHGLRLSKRHGLKVGDMISLAAQISMLRPEKNAS